MALMLLLREIGATREHNTYRLTSSREQQAGYSQLQVSLQDISSQPLYSTYIIRHGHQPASHCGHCKSIPAFRIEKAKN
jgi:hypothetical protein